MCLYFLFLSFSRSPISVAAAAIYMASQASDEKRSQKGSNERFFPSWLWNTVLLYDQCCLDHSLNQKFYLCVKSFQYSLVIIEGCVTFITSLPPHTSLMHYCAFQWHADSKIQSSTDKCVLRYRESIVRWVLSASDHCRALFRCLNFAQRFDYRALGSSRKLGGAAEHLIDGTEKRICQLSFES